MKRSFRLSQVLFHPSTLAVFSGVFGALIGLLINLVSGGHTSQMILIALVFAMLFSLGLSSWQVYSQEKTGKQWMTMLQELVFQTYFLTVLTDKPEVSQMAQHRLGRVLATLEGEQQLSMLKFFSHNGLPATFIGDSLQGSDALAGADLQKFELPQINLENTNLSRVNFSGANLSAARLSVSSLYRANLSGSDLSHAILTGADLRGADLHGANLTGADLSGAAVGMAKVGRDAPGTQAQGGAALRPKLKANLSHALLTEAKLHGTHLRGVDLSEANLRGADLSNGYLGEANLQGADLSNANLTKAIFISANLQHANLTGANLSGAIFEQADLRQTKLTDEQWQAISMGKPLKREP